MRPRYRRAIRRRQSGIETTSTCSRKPNAIDLRLPTTSSRHCYNVPIEIADPSRQLKLKSRCTTRNIVRRLRRARWRLCQTRNRLGILRNGFTELLVCFPPSIETISPNPKIPASLAYVANLLGMLKHSKLASNVPFFVRQKLHPPKSEKFTGIVPSVRVCLNDGCKNWPEWAAAQGAPRASA